MSSKQQKNLCPKGKYWVPPYERQRIDKNGTIQIVRVKGYCSSYRTPFHIIAEVEKISLDHLYFALTVYGEARSENYESKRAIAWIIQNRLKRTNENTYQKVVLRKTQFSCWNKKDANYEKLKHPGKDGSLADKQAWEDVKIIIKEVMYASESQNPLQGVYNYFSGNPKKKWQTHYFDLPNVPRFHFVKFK